VKSLRILSNALRNSFQHRLPAAERSEAVLLLFPIFDDSSSDLKMCFSLQLVLLLDVMILVVLENIV
jgi:hypothetical protein